MDSWSAESALYIIGLRLCYMVKGGIVSWLDELVWRVDLSASERDTYRGNTIENRGYMFGRMYVILYFDPPYFCVRSAFNPVPNFTKQNPPV